MTSIFLYSHWVRPINLESWPANSLNVPAVFLIASLGEPSLSNTSQNKDSVSSRELQVSSKAAIRQTDQTRSHSRAHAHARHQSAGHDGVSIFSPQYSVCVEGVLITMCSLRARPVLMRFLLLLSFSFPSLLPLPAFQLTLGFGNLICLSIQINLHLIYSSWIINIS